MKPNDDTERSSADIAAAGQTDSSATFDDGNVRELLAEAGRTWQVLQHDLESQWKRPRA